MSEFFLNGPAGRLEAHYHKSTIEKAPIVLILHPHPKYGGTMNNKVIFNMYSVYKNQGFSVLRFNFRGVGKSEGVYDNGVGELNDANAAFDWLINNNQNAALCWIAGFSFGSWIAFQLLMRRPEIQQFTVAAPPVNMFDLNFISPAPTTGLIIYGTQDQIVPLPDLDRFSKGLEVQKNLKPIHYVRIEGANHFFDNHKEAFVTHLERYIQTETANQKK